MRPMTSPASPIVSGRLKQLYSSDIHDLENFDPEEAEPFCVHLTAMCGPAQGDGEESFDFTVCNPAWLEQNLPQIGPTFARHYILASRFCLHDIRSLIERYVQGCSGNSWNEVGTKIGRMGYWEFEDYKDA